MSILIVKWLTNIEQFHSNVLYHHKFVLILSIGDLVQIWTEYTERNPSDQMAGNVNFLPGMGAFLQSLIYGFAGFRLRPDKLECHDPQPPPGSTTIELTNFKYLGSNLTFTITADKTTIRVLSASSAFPLLLMRNSTGAVEETLRTGKYVYFSSHANWIDEHRWALAKQNEAKFFSTFIWDQCSFFLQKKRFEVAHWCSSSIL